ncbi:MAG: hypothetical protein A2086_17045 [Spirochaetes bacterium GWD1_27_9]|nr:MAG: hypothetical protein A2Z98_15370 [Spirochaetes bacterium GWB1_27_13]OHD27374.1 MAG: hypothetical protein A2Y34_07625 [Spirochaetes bacterium GWC1_27_15]OHD33336.1 MAG: hypothetical protein A2086_17045 [Spirochaetes bacterium GWD1_27_9]
MKKCAILFISSVILSVLLFNCANNIETEPSNVNKKDVKMEKLSSSSSPEMVKLLFAKTQINGVGMPYKIKVFIEVENVSPTKEVILHYTETMTSDTSWRDQQAVYLGKGIDNKDVFVAELGFASPGSSFFDLNVIFAIKYSVNGTVYWDSNDGNNYKVAIAGRWNQNIPHYILKNSIIALSEANISGSTLTGSIILKNLNYYKTIKVVYTTDGWKTSNEILAQYSGSNGIGDEMWNFNSTLPTDSNNIEFVISYQYENQTIWDNNFGKNYKMTIPSNLF